MQGGGREFDKYSVYVDNLDYWCTVQHLMTHFEGCGTVNRITIPTNEFGNPQGHAYVEFSDLDSVDKALLLNGSILRSQEITVARKKKYQSSGNPNKTTRPGNQAAADFRTVGGNSNKSSRPPYANRNNNPPIQQQRQQPPSASSSNSRPIGTAAAAANNQNRKNSSRPLQQQPPPDDLLVRQQPPPDDDFTIVGANRNRSSRPRPAYANTNINRPPVQQRRPSSSNSRFSYVRPIGINSTTTTNSGTTAKNENTDSDIKAP